MTTRTYSRWTDDEIQILREHWPTGGMRAVAVKLPHRSCDTIKQMAFKNGIRKAKK